MLFFKGMKNRSNGFTLMEVLVCTTLLVSIIGLSSALLLTTSRYLERSRSHLMGEYVAEKVMEQVLSTDFYDINSLATTGRYTMETTLRGKKKTLTFSYQLAIKDVSPRLKSVAKCSQSEIK